MASVKKLYSAVGRMQYLTNFQATLPNPKTGSAQALQSHLGLMNSLDYPHTEKIVLV